MDFRQILKAFTDVRHQLNRMEAKQDRMENSNEAVNELAEVHRFRKQSLPIPRNIAVVLSCGPKK